MRISFIALIVLLFSGNTAFSQLSKQESKEWKKKLKSTSPEAFKSLTEENEMNQNKILELEADKSQLETKVIDLEAEVEKLKIEVEDLENTAKAIVVKETQNTNEGAYNHYEQQSSEGILYKVQIGAFKNFDITKYFDNHKNFSGDVDEDGTMKYTIGVFKDYWEADKFKKYLRDMGVGGAWVVAYKNGKRVNIKDALEGAI